MKRSREIDMTDGPIFSKLVVFTLPLMFTAILQILFNAADVIVVGKFAGSLALAAVGSNGALINLLVNLFIGISTGANVLAARSYGSREYEEMHRCVHCSMLLSVVLGIIVGIAGFFLSTPLLSLMQTDPVVLPLANLYLKIYFIGVPATIVYNFGSAILRAIGDTDRPLKFLFLSGIINIVLNLVLVVGFKMSVAGVAIATAVSQYVAALLVVICLIRSEGPYQLHLKKLRFYKDTLLSVIQIGLPAGMQSTIFSLSNVTIQSAINSFGYITMAGNSAASNIDSFIYMSMNAVYYAALCFTSQNMGAKKIERLDKIMWCCLGLVTLIGLVASSLIFVCGPSLLSLYISGADANRDAVIAVGMIRLAVIGLPYVFCGHMEVATGVLRGMGKSWTPMVISTLGACVFRIIWVATIFEAFPTLPLLYLCYPISWIITMVAHFVVVYFTRRKIRKQFLPA